MSEKENKRQRIYDLLYAETKPYIFEIIGVSLWPQSSLILNSLDYVIWVIIENKVNATSLLNNGSLKTTIEKEWNIISTEFILKSSKSLWRCVVTINEKEKVFTVLCLASCFIVYFLRLKLILFYKSKSKVSDRRWGRLEGSLFNSYYTEFSGRELLLTLDCSTLPLTHNL